MCKLILLAVLAPASAAAQTVGATVHGIVSGPSGEGFPDAAVTVVNEETNETRRAVSGKDGEFTVAVLQPGSYRIEAELPGFRRYVGRGVLLSVGQEVRLRITLEPGLPSEEIIVTAKPGMVQQDSAAVGTVIDNRQVLGLPLDGRNFLELSLLVPGAAPSAPGSPGSVRGEFTVNVNGAREDSNNFILDGVFNNDPKLNTFAVTPPADAIREFEILTSSYDAVFGRSGGAQVNIALKSGTNGLHGTVYHFLRNAALDARNFFAQGEGKPRYQRNQFGFSVGGPLRRDRTFFFADYEGRRLREGLTQVTNVPTALERRGDFSQSASSRPVDPFTQRPFPDGRIPESRQDPIGRAIAGLYPLPNRPVQGQNFVSSPALRDRDDRFDVRIDHVLSSSSSIFGRYSFSDRDLFEPFAGPSFARIPGYGTRVPRRAQNFVIGENHVFSSSLVHEFRVAFNRVAAGSFHENMGRSVNREVGLPELSANSRDFGLSFITISGYSPLGDEFNNPQHSVTNTFQILDTLSFTRGAHLFRFGFDFRSLQQNAFRDVQSRGFLTFSDFGRITGNGLADLLLGFVSFSGGARLDNPQYLRTRSWSWFAQDTWRVSRNVTLLLGLRYEYNAPPVDRFDRANTFVPASGTLEPVGRGGVPRGVFRADRNNWAPRIGLAWAPRSGGSTVLHAGYGIYYDQSSLAPGEGLYFNQPFFDFSLYFPLPGLPLTVGNPFPASFPFSLPGTALGFDGNLRTAYLQHWNLKVQQELGSNRLVEIAYVGSKGTRLLTARDINQPGASPRVPNPRPLPAFEDVVFLESRGSSSYHSMQVGFQQRFESGLSAMASYTLGRSLDDASTFFSSFGDANFPQNSRNVGAEKGRSNFDLRQRLSLSYSWELPFGSSGSLASGRGWLHSLLGGWTANGIVTLQTGRPFTVAILPEIDNSNTGRATLGFGANDRPDRLASGRKGSPSPEAWFDTSAFAFPAFGTFGNSGRNILDGPGFKDVSVSFVKVAPLREGIRLQLRAEFFNFFNNTNFDLPDIFLGSPTFGRVSSARSPRRIQFGLKLIF